MAENRYNVDDILREVKEKRAREERTARPEGRREATTPEDLLRQLDAAQAGVRKTAAPTSKPQPAPAKRTEPVKKTEPSPAELLRKAEKPAEPAKPAEPEFLWEEPKQQEPVVQPEEWTLPEAEEPQPTEPEMPAAGGKAPAGREIPAARVKQPLWEASAARKSAEALMQTLKKRQRGLAVTLIINLIMLAGVIYLALAPVYHLLLPGALATTTYLRLRLMVGLTALSALCCGGTLGNGFLALFPGRQSNDAYVTLTVFACLLQGSFMSAQPDLLAQYGNNIFLPLAALILFFNTWGKLVKNARQRESCRAMAMLRPVACRTLPESRLTEWAAELPEQPEKTVTLDDAGLPEDAEAVLEETGMTESLSGVLAPITILAAVVMALLEYFLAKGTVFEAVSIFTSALCITSPLAATLGSHMPLRSANEGLNRWRANLLNEDAVEELHDTDGVLLRGSDLFPGGSITLHGIRTFEKKPIDEAILNAASVLCSVDNSLTGIFRGMITNEKNLKPVESITCEEGRGISAWVDGGRVLIGNRSLLLAHGVAVPPMEVEASLSAEGKELLYLSNFGSLSAGFVISYHADKQLKTQLRELEKAGIALLVHTTDPNITPERVAQVYGLQTENIHMVPATLQREAELALDGTGETAAEMVSGSMAGSLHSLLSAQREYGIAKAISVLLVLSVLIGFAIITLLAYSGALNRVTWWSLGAYQLLWFVPTVLLGWVRKK